MQIFYCGLMCLPESQRKQMDLPHWRNAEVVNEILQQPCVTLNMLKKLPKLRMKRYLQNKFPDSVFDQNIHSIITGIRVSSRTRYSFRFISPRRIERRQRS